MLEFIMATIVTVLAGGHCPESDEYPAMPCGYHVADYLVIDQCAIPVVEPTR